MNLFKNIRTARFIGRPNRFVVECQLGRRVVKAHLPNPGKLLELFFPDSILLLTKNAPSLKTPYTCVGVMKEGKPVMLHTHHTNTVARHLIDSGRIPGLEDYKVLQAEVPYGHSRFDFLLQKKEKKFLLEVKSCTLFSGPVAMFPDAVTERGRRHIVELSHLKENNLSTGVLFVVQSPDARFFLPEYHTDIEFSRTLIELKDRIFIQAIGVAWKDDLTLGKKIHKLHIPWEVIIKEAADRGSYIIVLHLPRTKKITIGSLQSVTFPTGYYLYVGSAMKNLSQRIQRHQRMRKTMHWHIDYLRNEARFITALPVRSSERLECSIARSLKKVVGWEITKFGSSDCGCPSHLFGMSDNPLLTKAVIDVVQHYRMDRLRPLLLTE